MSNIYENKDVPKIKENLEKDAKNIGKMYLFCSYF